MLRCRKDTTGVIELTLSYIGLILASAILLTVVFSVVFSNDWHRTAELQSLTSDFSNLLLDLQNLFFESENFYQFPQKNYQYHVYLSTQYIAISAEGSWGTNLFITKRFPIGPWPRLSTQNWTTGTELHSYLNETYGHQGVYDDPISAENFTGFLNEYNTTATYFALHPYEIQLRKPVILEKICVYYDSGMNHDFLLVYQQI